MLSDTDDVCVAIALTLCLNMSDNDVTCVAIALALCSNMLSAIDAAFVVIALVLCLNRRCIKQWYKRRPQFKHQNLMTELVLSKPNYYRIIFFVRFDCSSFDGTLKTFTITVVKGILI